MPDSASKKLARVKEIITEGKIEDAFQLVNDIKQRENLIPKNALRVLYYKADLYSGLREFDLALNLAEELYQKSQELKMPFFSLDALALKGWCYFIGKGRSDEYLRVSH